MKKEIIGALLRKGRVSVGEMAKEGAASSYSFYKTADELREFGVAGLAGGKLELSEGRAADAFRRLFFEGFEIELLSGENVRLLVLLLEPKTTAEIARETGKSIAQARRLMNGVMQFLGKEGKKFAVSRRNAPLVGFLEAVRERDSGGAYWSRAGEKLLKLPRGFPFEGTLTGFSRFGEFGLSIRPAYEFVFRPERELNIEEILAHAIKFSQNANDLALCILFYMQNRHRMNALELEKECEKFGIMPLWIDIVSFLEEQPVKEKPMFLPRNEFLEKAAVYGIKTKRRVAEREIEALFSEAEEKLRGKIRVFSIGGNALIEHGAKTSTKDIDIVVLSRGDAAKLSAAFKSIGFSEFMRRDVQYERLGTSAMLERENSPRVDLFAGKVCNALEFSGRMVKRSRRIREGRLELYLVSLEDLFLLKSISSRDSDIIDCENILRKSGLDWKVIYSEIAAQESGLKALCELVVLEHFETLEKRLGVKIPISGKIAGLCLEKGILFLAKRPVSVAEIAAKIKFPEAAIRNKIAKLLGEKRLKKIRGKPFRVAAGKH
ncbi:MAG: DUF6036 family nucleotidyltransferase [Candidatus Diapherotrites archaeon]|nr:hypothetical protein [Candidatus Micrarchaeota archaeon]MBU1939355.1 hypothetical protein [Candidatus Micrarchaeota archaeon]